jgi:uncharacterized membrane protein YhaH (DUF805 family)
MHWYLEALRKYADFSGRARRREFWYFYLFHLLAVLALMAIEIAVDLGGFLPMIYAAAVVLPAIAVGVRRLHDTGRSAGWILVPVVPVVGAIVLLVFLVRDGQPHTNDYGPDPKLAERAVAAAAALS